MKILANDGISQNGIDVLNAANFEVITKTVDQDKLIDFYNTLKSDLSDVKISLNTVLQID